MTDKITPPVPMLTPDDLLALVKSMPHGQDGFAKYWGYQDLAYAAEREVHRRYEARRRRDLATFITMLQDKEPNGKDRFGEFVVTELGDLLTAVMGLPVTLDDLQYPTQRILAAINVFNDAYRAFVGAFDTPVARRHNPDEYSEDARQRMRQAAQRFDSLAASLGTLAAQPSHDPLEGTSDQAKEIAATIPNDAKLAYIVEWTKYEGSAQRHDGYTYAATLSALSRTIKRVEGDGKLGFYTKAGPIRKCLVDDTLYALLLNSAVVNTNGATHHKGFLGFYRPHGRPAL